MDDTERKSDMKKILEWLFGWLKRGNDSETKLPPIIVTDTPTTGGTETKPETADEIDLSTVKWHGPDIRAWPITADLKASISRGEIMLGTELLKGKKESGDNGTSGNPWAIVMGTDGQWHAYTYEWTSYSRKSRSLWKAFDRGHGAPSVCAVEGGPKSGTEFYVAVATVSRGVGGRNGDERTPFRKVVVP